MHSKTTNSVPPTVTGEGSLMSQEMDTPTTTTTTSEISTVPLKALTESRAKRQALEATIAALESANAERTAAEETAAALAAAERGEFKDLHATEKARADDLEARLTTMTTKETARLERLSASLDTRIEALPEGLRVLIPPGMALDARAEQIEKIEALASDQTTYPAGTRRGKGGKVEAPIPEACTAEANSHGKYGDQAIQAWHVNVWLPREARRAARNP